MSLLYRSILHEYCSDTAHKFPKHTFRIMHGYCSTPTPVSALDLLQLDKCAGQLIGSGLGLIRPMPDKADAIVRVSFSLSYCIYEG